ncbi:hypothetical protein Turpa_1227 [Turneriella parva DSM 21527]|uniref:Uncharacterized protein n=1 Tax=Turneriella parva (strain ATCC BAA-1111 / DSM 21527 / NCTC 11395 / H) TaxID=869212 RepID=I4B3L8_TURPD|nr:hypothetical protein Turpa_1227 [Turneriella parva DSM 21527]
MDFHSLNMNDWSYTGNSDAETAYAVSASLLQIRRIT